MRFARLLSLFLLSFALGVLPAAADSTRDGGPAQGILDLLPADAVTRHVLKTKEGELPYRATAGTIAIRGQDGRISARIFYTAYIARAAIPRPLTFAFNGGPGAASAYLHLGFAGPRIVDFGPNGNDGATARLRDNPESWLRFTDLVFIDPVGTGWTQSMAPNDDGSSGQINIGFDYCFYNQNRSSLYINNNGNACTYR